MITDDFDIRDEGVSLYVSFTGKLPTPPGSELVVVVDKTTREVVVF